MSNTGAVFVFDEYGTLLRTIPNPAPGLNDNFGSSVAVDRHGNIIVGAELDGDPDGPDEGLPNMAEAGAAFVFNGTTGELLHTLFDPYRSPVNNFGSSVAVDRHGNIVVGAPLKEIDGVAGGAVFVFDAVTGALLRIIPNPAPETSDNFGDSVAVALTDGDGDEDEEVGLLVIGAPWDNDPDGPDGPIPGVVSAGAAFIYDTATGALLRTFANPAPGVGDAFGASVAAGRADDADEVGHLVIGASWDDDPDGPGPVPEALNAGAVFLFRRGE